jgi:hypothetical protein
VPSPVPSEYESRSGPGPEERGRNVLFGEAEMSDDEVRTYLTARALEVRGGGVHTP